MRPLDPLMHPAIELLVQRARDPGRVLRRAQALVDWLVGQGTSPEPPGDPWMADFIESARPDLEVVRLLCRGRPLRTMSAAAALLVDLDADSDDAASDDDDSDNEPSDPDGEDCEGSEDARDSNAGDGDGELAPSSELLDADGVLPPGAQEISPQLLLGGDGRPGLEGALGVAQQCAEIEHLLGALLPAYGWDTTSGTLERMLLGRFDLFERLLRRSERLRKLADLLGRMERSERQHSGRSGHGVEQVVGVRTGGDLEEVLPCEWALLGDAGTEDLFYQRFAERRLLSLEVRGDFEDEHDASERKGPIIACVDTSASMRGAPEESAKALVLCLARRALKQRRSVHVMLFGGRDDLLHLQLRGGRAGMDQLLDFLIGSFHAGTDFDGPLLEALDLTHQPGFRNADILVVTDGLCRAGGDVVQKCLRARRETGLSIASVVIAGPHGLEISGVNEFSDRVFAFNPHSPSAEPLSVIRGTG